MGRGAFISDEKSIMKVKKEDKTRRMSRVPGSLLTGGARIPANGITHVGSKNVNRPEVSGIDP